jgi:hypothetical protein
MKQLSTLVLIALVWVSCKKDDPTPPPSPEPVAVQSGTLTLKVQAYDSLGQKIAPMAGQRVRLDASHSATTDASGSVTFSDLSYGDYFPSVVRDFWEGAPVGIHVAAASTSSDVILAQIAPWKAQSFTALAIRPDSIIINFKLDRPVPAGKQVNMALITSTANTLSGNNYMCADQFFASSDNVNQLNIANFARFKNLVASLDSGQVYFIKILPVSYGDYSSNVIGKSLLLGDNLFPPDNWLIKKEWK